MNRIAIALLLGAAALPGTVSAQDKGSITTARAIVAALHLERMLDPTFQQMMPMVVENTLTAMAQAPEVPADVKAKLATQPGRQAAATILNEEMMKAFRARYAAIDAATSEEYAAIFSEPELKAILAFYSTQAGAKLLAMQPQMQKTLSEAGRAVGRDAGTEAFPKAIARIQASPPSVPGK